MKENHLWNRAKNIQMEIGPEIAGGFDIGFDRGIPEQTKDMLMQFVYWVEDHFSLPVTLWVDFKYNHYLKDEAGKPVYYKFYWAAFSAYPKFENPDDIPVIELPVRLEKRSRADILRAFIAGISRYYLWLMNDPQGTMPDNEEIEAVLQAYLQQ